MNALLRTLIFFGWHVSNLETCFSSVGWAVQYFEHKNTWMQDYYTEFCYKNLARLLLGEFGYSAFGVKTKRVSFHLFFQVTTKNPLWVALPAFYIFSWSFSSSPIELRTHKLPFFDIYLRGNLNNHLEWKMANLAWIISMKKSGMPNSRFFIWNFVFEIVIANFFIEWIFSLFIAKRRLFYDLCVNETGKGHLY